MIKTEPSSARPADVTLAGATVVDISGLRQHVDIHIRDGIIDGVVPAQERSRRAVEVIDYRGYLVIPAYINSHHHFATGLLRLMPPGPPTRNQRERLERVIWPFERQLTRADVRLAVQLGIAEAIVAGTTVIIDHHVSSNCAPRILDLIAEEVVASGVQAVLSYEISDRDGAEVAATAITENERFLQSTATTEAGPRGMVGLHALSTVGPESLARAVDLAGRYAVGLHLHLGESDHDNVDSVARYGARPIARLVEADALNSRTLAAHAVHITEHERDILAERQVMVAHCPRSNASNGVGMANLDAFHDAGLTVGLGGDGFTQDMRADMDVLPLLQRLDQRRSAALPTSTHLDVGVNGSARIVERLAGWRLGHVDAGYQASLIGLRYDPILPLHDQNALWHYGRGFPGATVRDVWSHGRRLLRGGELQTVDVDRIRSEVGRRLDQMTP